jgi:hypothetical protein
VLNAPHNSPNLLRRMSPLVAHFDGCDDTNLMSAFEVKRESGACQQGETQFRLAKENRVRWLVQGTQNGIACVTDKIARCRGEHIQPSYLLTSRTQIRQRSRRPTRCVRRHLQVLARGTLPLHPSCPVCATSAFSRIKFLATKSLQKFLRVRGLLETIDVKPLSVVIERVAA